MTDYTDEWMELVKVTSAPIYGDSTRFTAKLNSPFPGKDGIKVSRVISNEDLYSSINVAPALEKRLLLKVREVLIRKKWHKTKPPEPSAGVVSVDEDDQREMIENDNRPMTELEAKFSFNQFAPEHPDFEWPRLTLPSLLLEQDNHSHQVSIKFGGAVDDWIN